MVKRGLIVIFIISILVIAGLFLFSRMTGNAIFDFGKPKDVCSANFQGLKIDLGSLFEEKRINLNECRNIANNKERIIEEVCYNSQTLGNVEIKFGNKLISSFEIECNPENFEDGDYVSSTGELSIIIGDDFERGKADKLYVIQDNKSKKFYGLELKEGKIKREELKAGDIIEVRGKKTESNIILDSDGFENLVKVGGKNE